MIICALRYDDKNHARVPASSLSLGYVLAPPITLLDSASDDEDVHSHVVPFPRSFVEEVSRGCNLFFFSS